MILTGGQFARLTGLYQPRSAIRCLLDAVVTGGNLPSRNRCTRNQNAPQLCDHFGERSLDKIQDAHIGLLQLKFAPEIRRGIDQNQ